MDESLASLYQMDYDRDILPQQLSYDIRGWHIDAEEKLLRFANDIFKYIFLKENVEMLFKIWLK